MESVLKKLDKILVANRGEIAVRIFRAASELRLRTVAMYSDEDRYSLHRYKADEAYMIGKDGEALKPYLDIEAIIQVAKQNDVACFPWSFIIDTAKHSPTVGWVEKPRPI